MNMIVITDHNEAVPAHPTEFYDIVERSKAERKELIDFLTQIEEKAHGISGISNRDILLQSLRDLLKENNPLSKRLNTYVSRQRKAVYPFLIQYFNLSTGPSIHHSFWKLERDLGLVENYMESFTDTIDFLSFKADAKQITGILRHLTQACQLMKQYLRVDDILITPLSEEVLTDMDYFYS